MFIAFLLLLITTTCQTIVLIDNEMESGLKGILQARNIPAEMSITYSDLHGLWGGTKVTIKGAGSAEIQERDQAEPELRIHKSTLNQDQILELIKLLVDLKVWEQRTPERTPRPDESRSTLTIDTGKHSQVLWEWFNDMEKDQRLIKIKTKMIEMVKKK